MAANAQSVVSIEYPLLDRISNVSVQDFRAYKRLCRPAILTDVMSHWAALRWTWDMLSSRYGTTEVAVSMYRGGWYKASDAKRMQFRDFIDGLRCNDWESFPYYIRDSWELFAKHPELLADCAVPEHFFDWSGRLGVGRPGPRLFVGPKGAVTPMHVDIYETHAWLTQVIGRKRWVLVSPKDGALMKATRINAPGLTKYRVDPWQCDLREQFPGVSPLECVLAPGETIFVPSGWAHHVTSLDAGVSITWNFVGPGAWKPAARAVAARISSVLKKH